MIKRSFAVGCLAVSTTALVACGGNSTEGRANTAAPTTTASAKVQVQVPSAAAQTGATQVRFDPCVSVGDELVSRAGFDPATRERAADESSSSLLTTIGCQFWREELVDGEKFPTGGLGVTSSDMTLDEIRRNPGHSVFNSDPIGGREAVLYRTPQVPISCTASIKAPDGVLTVRLTVPPGPVAVPEPCDQIRRLAEIFSESLGGN
ncbi:DUF3558 domain-containing protein [Nocardia fluminea]|uniref:DUF3558 domain-containing protein n=1 Tax=Nocardia fluminea TaxID=134984 RepID=UPI00382D3F08